MARGAAADAAFRDDHQRRVGGARSRVARNIRVTESLGAVWEAIKGGPQAAAEPAGCCAEVAVRYVCSEPPTRLSQGEKESARIPIRASSTTRSVLRSYHPGRDVGTLYATSIRLLSSLYYCVPSIIRFTAHSVETLIKLNGLSHTPKPEC
jgi:hypothetical protein